MTYNVFGGTLNLALSIYLSLSYSSSSSSSSALPTSTLSSSHRTFCSVWAAAAIDGTRHSSFSRVKQLLLVLDLVFYVMFCVLWVTVKWLAESTVLITTCNMLTGLVGSTSWQVYIISFTCVRLLLVWCGCYLSARDCDMDQQPTRYTSRPFWHQLPIFQVDLHCTPHCVATSPTCRRIGDRAFSVTVAALRAWNRLPTELKLLRLTDLFCRDLKTFLFYSVYGHQDTDWLCDVPSVFQ